MGVVKPITFSIMKAYIKENFGQESKREILAKYANDIRESYDDGYLEEWWIGEKGTTTLKSMTWCEGVGTLIDFGKTISELRKDPTFFKALLTDEDVNHSLISENPFDINEKEYSRILEWLHGVTNDMPITSCGAYNYFDSYVGR